MFGLYDNDTEDGDKHDRIAKDTNIQVYTFYSFWEVVMLCGVEVKSEQMRLSL